MDQKFILKLSSILGLIGLVDSSYLAFEHYQGIIPPCTITKGCESVLTSSYAMLFGIPLVIFGIFFYLLVLSSLALNFYFKKNGLLYFHILLTLGGFLFSLRLVYLQLFIIRSICLYCMVSAITSTLIFIGAIIFLKLKTNIRNNI